MSSGRSTRQDRQRKAAEMRAAAARAQARRRSLLISAAVLVAIALVVGIFVVIQNSKHNSALTGATPKGFDSFNSVTVGQATAPVTIVAYEDFQCPNCLAFEEANSAQLAAWVKAGTVKIQYRPIAILDRSSTTNYSTRALNAAAALVNVDPAGFATFHQELFDNQPAEGTAGLSDAKLLALAVQAGAPQAAMETAIDNQTFKAWTARVTDASSKAGVTGTPTVKVNGTTLSDDSAASLKTAVEAAAK